MRRLLRTLSALPLLAPLPAAAQESETSRLDALQQQVQVLAEELLRLREGHTIEEDALEPFVAPGLGPAASKVYGIEGGVSLGGYGEMFFEAPLEDTARTGDRRRADTYRFIAYLGYKFSPRILMNTEVEFEHATTGSNPEGKTGEVSLEFSYLEFLLRDSLRLRVGNLLLPIGLVNEMHEPPFYRGNARPEVERRILPSTWRELGVGLHGRVGARLDYAALLLNGLNAAGFDEKGLRGGRQKGNQALWEDVAGLLSMRLDAGAGLRLGSTVFYGGADQGGILDADGRRTEVSTLVWEFHVQYARGGLLARALLAGTSIEGARGLSQSIFDDATDTGLIPSRQRGGSLELAYDVAPLLLRDPSLALRPWIRWERLELQREVPTLPGHAADPALDQGFLTLGLELQPHPSVVIKLDWEHRTHESEAPLSDRLRLGAGFVY